MLGDSRKDSAWTLEDFQKIAKNKEHGLTWIACEKRFRNFLKKRPLLFGMTETHVWNASNRNMIDVCKHGHVDIITTLEGE